MAFLHIPKFTSQAEMIGFLRAVPDDANYAKMLGDFGYVPPEDADAHTVQYFWKYLVQGRYYGKTGSDLEQYAVAGVEKHAKTFPWLKNPKIVTPTTPAVSVVVKKESSRQKVDKSDGVRFLAHRGVWIGCVGGKCVVTKKTEEKCKEVLRVKFGMDV